MTCVMVDDQPSAIKLLLSYVKSTGSLTFLNAFTDSLEALDYVRSNSVDLLFLDIEMPKLSGLDLLHNLEKNCPLNCMPRIIFTTGYIQYKLDSISSPKVVDILYKPFGYDEFSIAIQRLL